MPLQCHPKRPVRCIYWATIILLTPTSFVQAQVIQLPSVHNFSYSGSAWVPDGGSASLGGHSGYGATSATRGFGPYSSRSTSANLGGSSVTISAQVIDLAALDQALLNSNVPSSQIKPGSTVISADSPAADGIRSYLTNSTAREDEARGSDRYRDWQRVLAGGSDVSLQHPAVVESNIRYYLRMGKEAEQANRILASRVYYRMAMEAMTPELTERYEKILADRKIAEAAEREAAKKASRKSF